MILLSTTQASAYGISGSYTDLNGFKIPYSSYEGNILVVEVFQVGCDHCHDHHPNLVELNADYGSQIRILSLASPSDTVEEIQTYLETYPSPWDVGRDTEGFGRSQKVTHTPTTIVFKKNGEKYVSWQGPVNASIMGQAIDIVITDPFVSGTTPSDPSDPERTPWEVIIPLLALTIGGFYLVSRGGENKEKPKKKSVSELLKLD